MFENDELNIWLTVDDRQTNGGLGEIEDVDAESELSEPDSDAGSPPDIAKEMSANRASPSETNDQEMRDVAEDEEAPISHYPKRKRNSMYQNLNDNKSDLDVQLEDDKDARNKAPPAKRPASAGRLPVTSTAAMRAVNLGHWRDSPVTEVARKHSVIGFIDARDRLRTRIQTTNSRDEHIAKEYPLPPGPGGSWLTFDKIAFLPHLVSLDQYEVKEYVRTRRDARPDETEAEREKADMEAVEKAQRHLTEHPNIRNPTVQPIIAHGQELPAEQTTGRPESKRRRTSGNFTPIVPANANGSGTDVATPDQPSTPSPVALDPLPGTRPTRILIGYWKGSDQVKEADRHAVYGILGQNDMFRVKLTRETRDGRRVDGNFPAGAGALWIGYDEVAHEPHLKDFNRQEIKEFCRVRQWQMDQAGDEKDEERQDNIKEAALEAKRRVLLLAGNASATRSTPATRSAPGATPLASNTDNDASTANTTSTSGPETPTVNGHSNGTNPEQRQSRRLAEPRNMDRAERADGHTRRQFVDIEPRPASSRAAPQRCRRESQRPCSPRDRTRRSSTGSGRPQRSLSRTSCPRSRHGCGQRCCSERHIFQRRQRRQRNFGLQAERVRAHAASQRRLGEAGVSPGQIGHRGRQGVRRRQVRA